MCPVWHCWCQCVLTVHQWHARDNTEIWNMFPSCFIPLLCTHISVSPICSPADFCWHRNWRRLALFDLFMRWHSMLALSLSLSLASYSVFLLTAFVHFINIKFWYSDRYESPEDTCSFSTLPKIFSLLLSPPLAGRQWLFVLWQISDFQLEFQKCIFSGLQRNTVCIDCTF